MKLTVNGVTFDNPDTLLIEVDPAGEEVGPWTIEFRGGPLTVRGTDARPVALLVNMPHPPAGLDAYLSFHSPGPVAVMIGCVDDFGPDATPATVNASQGA